VALWLLGGRRHESAPWTPLIKRRSSRETNLGALDRVSSPMLSWRCEMGTECQVYVEKLLPLRSRVNSMNRGELCARRFFVRASSAVGAQEVTR
jgi:hypothetical protein